LYGYVMLQYCYNQYVYVFKYHHFMGMVAINNKFIG
jgi:hypothetical protein